MENDKKPHRWIPTYNPEDILQVLPSKEEDAIKTSTIKKKLAQMGNDSELSESKQAYYLKYESVSKEWFRIALRKLLKAGKVEKIKKEDDVADYWRKMEE